jgi:hypothetical protein
MRRSIEKSINAWKASCKNSMRVSTKLSKTASSTKKKVLKTVAISYIVRDLSNNSHTYTKITS